MTQPSAQPARNRPRRSASPPNRPSAFSTSKIRELNSAMAGERRRREGHKLRLITIEPMMAKSAKTATAVACGIAPKG